MDKTIIIDGKSVRLRSSAAIPRMYRMKFRRDVISDMRTIQKSIERAQKAQKDGHPSEAPIPMEALTMFENIAYLMARHADPAVPDSVDTWLEGFDTFSIYAVFPVIQELWEHNLLSINQSAKK